MNIFKKMIITLTISLAFTSIVIAGDVDSSQTTSSSLNSTQKLDSSNTIDQNRAKETSKSKRKKLINEATPYRQDRFKERHQRRQDLMNNLEGNK